MEIRIASEDLADVHDEAAVLLLPKGVDAQRAVGAAGKPFVEGYETLAHRKAFAGDDGQVRTLTAARSDTK